MSPETSAQPPELRICDFPPELVARIMKLLAYFDILRASMVCKLWSAIILEDPEITQLLYKRACRSLTGMCAVAFKQASMVQ
ncbi:hypothetical protein C8R44DRAFT_51152 [Mycena epipterygia]|nr:hypothetical protein C8R44DRAFT_51152 [Mycena epipterygia]